MASVLSAIEGARFMAVFLVKTVAMPSGVLAAAFDSDGFALAPALAAATPPGADPGVGNVAQGVQPDRAYNASFASNHVTNVFVTGQQVSCYRPEVPVPFNSGPNDGYTGELPCPGANTGEDTGAAGPYAT